jgi:hypothetical protein
MKTWIDLHPVTMVGLSLSSYFNNYTAPIIRKGCTRIQPWFLRTSTYFIFSLLRSFLYILFVFNEYAHGFVLTSMFPS